MRPLIFVQDRLGRKGEKDTQHHSTALQKEKIVYR